MPYVQGRGWVTPTTVGMTIPFYTPEADQQVRIEMPVAGSISSYRLVGDDDIKIDVWKSAYADLPAADGDSITNANEPELSSVTAVSVTDLSGWSDVTFAAGDWLVFNVDSVGGSITYADLALTLET